MPALVSFRIGVSTRVAAAAVLAAVALSAIASFGAGRPAYADGKTFLIQSAANFGPAAGTALSPAVRLDPPAPQVTLPAAPAPTVVPVAEVPAVPVDVNRSNCRQDLANPVMTITIPDVSYTCPVYSGGQAMLDSGAATLITDPAIAQVLADRPGGAGLLWVAGHRTSHGGAFAAVPTLADGALITVSDDTYTATYRVVGRLYVTIRNDRVVDANGNATGQATLDSIIRPDHGGNKAARLLLQTCDGDTHRWMIYADLVA
ncbi:MAG: sortase [Ilumatobacteraceae bacterium]